MRSSARSRTWTPKKVKYHLHKKEVAKRVGISTQTLDLWYDWWEDDSIKKPRGIPKLPKYIVIDGKGRRMWDARAVRTIIKFKESIRRGRNGFMGAITTPKKGKKEVERAKKTREDFVYRQALKLRDEVHHVTNAFGESICGRKGYEIKYIELPKYKGKVKICHWCLNKLNMDGREINKGIRKIRTDSKKKERILENIRK